MALVIPKSVGGQAVVDNPEHVDPIEKRSASLVIPSSVGGTDQTEQPGQIQQAPETGIADIFTGSERIAATPELGTLPEFGTTEEGNTFKIAAGLLSTGDSRAQMDMIQDAIPAASFEKTPDGSIFIEVPIEGGGTRRSVLNRPGFSPQDLTTSIAQVLAFVPAAKLATLGRTLAQKIGIGALAAGATEQGLQEAQIGLLGREERDPTATVLSAGLGGLAETIVPAFQAIKQAKQTRALGAAGEELDQVAGNVKAAQEATKATNIPLFQAQQTVIPAQLEKQSFVAQLPAGTKFAVEGLRKQNKAAGEAVEKFINDIAPPEAVITGAEKVRTAAQSAVDRIKNIRAEKTSPLYKDAFAEGANVNTKPVKDFISSELKDLPENGEIAKALNKVRALIGGKTSVIDGSEVVEQPSLKMLHNAKLEIDQMIAKVGPDSLGSTTKAKLTEAKNILIDQIDEASGSYKAAREAFAEASPQVTKIQDSIVGKLAGLKDDQLKQVSSKIFDPAQTNPNVILKAKKAIQDVNPEAWDEIIRVELERRLGSVKSIGLDGSVENLPGQLFRAIFPNDKSTKVLMNALDKNGRDNLSFLQLALRRASLGRPGGSQTAAREEIKKELRGGITQSLRNFFDKPLSSIAGTSISAVSGTTAEAAFNRRVSILSKALFDTSWKAEMKQLKALDPSSPAAARALTQLFKQIEQSEGEK